MYNQVVSNEYEVALQIIKGMLQTGIITLKEFNKIDEKNRKVFIVKKPLNSLI